MGSSAENSRLEQQLGGIDGVETSLRRRRRRRTPFPSLLSACSSRGFA